MAKREDLVAGQLTVAGSDDKGTTIKQIRRYTATVNPAAAGSAGTAVSTSVTATGVRVATDVIIAVIPPVADAASLFLATAVVSADDTVLVKTVGGTVDPASGTYAFIVARF